MKRWDTDERGRGVASARRAVADLDRLREAMLSSDWVAEDPDLHLLPHVRSLCDDEGWRVHRAAVGADGALELDVEVAAPSWGAMREAGYRIVGTFAEANTHVVQHELNGGMELVVTTGMLEGDGPFAPHGHVVRVALARA
jgi:hypothetical protein